MGVDFEFRISNFEFTDSLPPSRHTTASKWPIGGPPPTLPSRPRPLISSGSGLPPTLPVRSRVTGRQIRNSKFEIRNFYRYVEQFQ